MYTTAMLNCIPNNPESLASQSNRVKWQVYLESSRSWSLSTTQISRPSYTNIADLESFCVIFVALNLTNYMSIQNYSLYCSEIYKVTKIWRIYIKREQFLYNVTVFCFEVPGVSDGVLRGHSQKVSETIFLQKYTFYLKNHIRFYRDI